MMVKKALILACMAIAATAFMAPTIASANSKVHFIHNKNGKHEQIQNGAHVDFTGPIAFGTPLGGFGCIGHATVELTTFHGHLKELEITTNTCAGTGALEGCELVDHELTGTPTITPTATDLHLYNFTLHNLFAEEEGGPGCGAEEAFINFPEITLTVDNTTAITTVVAEGEGGVEIFGLELPAIAEGHLEPYQSGTYGITVTP